MRQLILAILAVLVHSSVSAPVTCPFSSNSCKCVSDGTSPNTFSQVTCQVITGNFVPFDKSVGTYTVTGELAIQTEGYDLRIPANSFVAFKSIGKLSFSSILELTTQQITLDPNAFVGPKVDAFATNLFIKMIPLPEAVRQLGRNGLTGLSIKYAYANALNDNEFQDFRSLTSLEIDHSQFSALADNAFVGLEQKLTDLSLTANKLAAYPDKALNRLTKLQRLDLSNNQLQTVPQAVFSKLPNLVSVKLANNGISALRNGDFPANIKINTLNLDNNPITTLETGAFAGLKSLQKLQLSGTKLTSIDLSTFQTLNQLQILVLQTEMSLKSVIVSDKLPSNLQSLDLSFSPINTIDPKLATLIGNRNFQLLDISHDIGFTCDANLNWIAKYALCEPTRIDIKQAYCQNLRKDFGEYLKATVQNPCK